MPKTNVIRDNKILWAVKILTATFQFFATWRVFTQLFFEAGCGKFETYFTTICAILLIDAFFILVLHFLESAELNVFDKLSWALIGLTLMAAVLYIGYLDEGVMAFAPRIGFIGLVLADELSFGVEFVQYYFSRETVEQRLRNKQVIQRRKQDQKAWRQARKLLKKELVELHVTRERKTLGLTDKEPAPVVDKELNTEIEPGIFIVAENQYAWIDTAGTYHNLSATGQPYSLRGARLAQTKASHKNGHLSKKVQRTH